ncbi:polyketide cyclase [Marinomonas ostreistagni]|uniref:polyketide cyclase n=1 Tax=Marinomonas ostreistagni TaxID=359209 RepID=UPI00194E3863|nr:polyketide cyclase [Marinomonas ostreistagni]MBM6549866.1 polyketide cyclase [Marinomonas ostreistagni]
MQPTKALLTLRYITRIAAVIILIAVAVGFFLPADYRIERSVTVPNAAREQVEQQLFTASEWQNWMHIEGGSLQLTQQATPALSDATTYTIRYEGDTEKLGTLELTQVSNERVNFVVTPSQTTLPVPNQIELLSSAQGLTIQWVIEGELDAGFLSPYLALVANRIAGSNIEASLSKLTK